VEPDVGEIMPPTSAPSKVDEEQRECGRSELPMERSFCRPATWGPVGTLHTQTPCDGGANACCPCVYIEIFPRVRPEAACMGARSWESGQRGGEGSGCTGSNGAGCAVVAAGMEFELAHVTDYVAVTYLQASAHVPGRAPHAWVCHSFSLQHKIG